MSVNMSYLVLGWSSERVTFDRFPETWNCLIGSLSIHAKECLSALRFLLLLRECGMEEDDDAATAATAAAADADRPRMLRLLLLPPPLLLLLLLRERRRRIKMR